MVNATLVTVHGFWSNPATWDRLCAAWQADNELEGLQFYGYGYPSPKKPRLPLSWTRVPDLDDIAQTFAAEYATVLGRASNIAFVTHSQGGLVLQRFLAWMVNEGRARELARIRTIVMLACPNGGSQYLASIRHALGYHRHPQAANLGVLSKQVTDTQRAVLARIVHASGVGDHYCRIPFRVYAAGSDAIVSSASAQAAFPGAGTLAGNHFTILDPTAPGNRTADVIKHHILTDLAEQPLAPAQGREQTVPARPAEHGKPEVGLSRTQGAQVGDHNVQYNVFSSPLLADSVPHALPSDQAEPSAADGSGASSPEHAERSTGRAVQDNKPMARDETAASWEHANSSATPLDQLQALVDARDAANTQDEDLIIAALGNGVSAMSVARAMTVANRIGALPKGEITLHASTDPMIDLTFSWQYHIGDGRFSQPSGNFLGINAHVNADPGGLRPVINTMWSTTEKAENVIGRINEMLQQRSRWSGPKTINWGQVFLDLHQAIVLSVAYKRRDSTVDWHLHGGLYEMHGQDWAITEAGIEYRPDSQVVLSEADFPEYTSHPGRTGPAGPDRWLPPPPAGTDPAEWKHVLWRGQWHFPVYRGPARAQPSRWPCKTFPDQSASATRLRASASCKAWLNGAGQE
jgi:hypothetical protein